MSIHNAISDAAVKNNGGVGINLGASSVLVSNSLGDAVLDIAGSVVVVGDNVDKAVVANPLANNNETPIAKKLTSSLDNPRPELRRSIHKREAVETYLTSTAFRAGDWNLYTGTWINDPATSNDSAMVANDVAANPTRSVPGKLTYKLGTSVANTVDYASKTN